MKKTTLAALADAVHLRALGNEEASDSQRYVVGIAGPPAAGKSRLATGLRDEINDRWGPIAEIAPMDGWHLTNDQLTAIGARSRKGAPDTFDVEGFVDALCAVRRGGVVAWPVYDRSRHSPVPAGVIFDERTKIAVTEGNYLLLESPGWAQVQAYLDEAWYLDVDTETIENRLMRRHIAGGMNNQEAMTKIRSSDIPNARLIPSTRERAQMVLREDSGSYALIRDFLANHRQVFATEIHSLGPKY